MPTHKQARRRKWRDIRLPGASRHHQHDTVAAARSDIQPGIAPLVCLARGPRTERLAPPPRTRKPSHRDRGPGAAAAARVPFGGTVTIRGTITHSPRANHMTSDSLPSNREIVEYLCCVECGAPNLNFGAPPDPSWKIRLRLAVDCLQCSTCSSRYPVTMDDIPIMWTPAIRGLLEGQGGAGVLRTNADVYDAMSDRYMVSTRQDAEISERVQRAVALLLSRIPRSDLVHLDWGCGPGHVLQWTQSSCARRVGLDVSLANLRNARKLPNTLVVLGDAQRMPFADGAFDLVTESSVLHHVDDWRAAIMESSRVCRQGGGILVDSEPSRRQLDWSPLARWIFDSRWYAYHILSYVQPEKHMFRNVAFAKRNYWEAEIHNQPGKGFDPDEIVDLFDHAGVDAKVVMSPDVALQEGRTPGWKHIVLHVTSLHNPWDPRNGPFLVMGQKRPSGLSAGQAIC